MRLMVERIYFAICTHNKSRKGQGTGECLYHLLLQRSATSGLKLESEVQRSSCGKRQWYKGYKGVWNFAIRTVKLIKVIKEWWRG